MPKAQQPETVGETQTLQVCKLRGHYTQELQVPEGFLLSMLAAHAANTAGVAPMQTSSFQLFKRLDLVREGPPGS